MSNYFFEYMGKLLIVLLTLRSIYYLYRKVIPKKYTESNCPEDHDTLTRYGVRKCDKCGTIMNEY